MDLPAGDRPHMRDVPPAYATRRRRREKKVPRHWATYSRFELRADGWTARRISSEARGGRIVRARANVYLAREADDDCVAACAIGGRLTCVSELARWGVFVLDGVDRLHVEVPATGSRLRMAARPARLHWTRLPSPPGWASVDVIDALVAAVQCQTVRGAIATLDSALHLRLIGDRELDQVFAALPCRLCVLRRHLDRRAESGSESLMRLMLRRLGCRVDVQVQIRGVGRVDLLVDGWLIIECDSEAHHSTWAQQKEDRRRDQVAARLGYATYRPIAEDIFWHPEQPLEAVRGLLRSRARG